MVTQENQEHKDPAAEKRATKAKETTAQETASLQEKSDAGSVDQVKEAREGATAAGLQNPNDIQSDVTGPTHPSLNPQSLPLDASLSANQGGPDDLHKITQEGITHGLGAPEILRLQQQVEQGFPSNPMVPPEVVKKNLETQARIEHVRKTGREMSMATEVEKSTHKGKE